MVSKYWRFGVLSALFLLLPIAGGCSSGEPAVDEQSKTQSEVLGQHFQGRRPENFQKK
jgi:hypothetical protein